MKYRKLRILWSVAFSSLCLLLIVLWVRSYWWADYLHVNNGGSYHYYVEAQRGVLFSLFGKAVNASSWIDCGHHEVENYYRNFDYTFLGFYFGGDEMFPDIFIIDLPFWFLSPATVAFAAVPWIRWPPRFSLRLFLIAVTLVAAAFGASICAGK
jgi:hypothetical protein